MQSCVCAQVCAYVSDILRLGNIRINTPGLLHTVCSLLRAPKTVCLSFPQAYHNTYRHGYIHIERNTDTHAHEGTHKITDLITQNNKWIK